MLKRFFLSAALLSLPAFAAELEGVKAADTTTVEGKTLSLNGMGLRKKFIFNVYVASLYVEHPSKSADEILKADEVRRVELTMLRDLDAKTISESIKNGFEKAAGSNMASLKDRLDKFMSKIVDMKKGQVFVVQYVPGKGTVIDGAKDSYTAEGKDFADALFSVWLGSSPVDEGLKKGMLGQK
ncbi:MAG: chalcone isomerase family protein [Myxococcota bacterium]